MKKYSFLFIIAVFALIIAVVTPELMYVSLPKVEYLKVKKLSTDLSVAVKGKISKDENGKYFANLFIGEDVFSKIKKGQNLTISGSAFEKTYKGKITSIGEVANGEDSIAYVQATAKISNPKRQLKSGFNIKANVITKKIKNKIIIPSNSILQDKKGEYIYKINKTKAEKVYIKTGEITDKGTVIKTNLKENDYIVLNPEKLKAKEEDVVIKNV